MVKNNTCVFISGSGTNLKNLISKTREYNFPIKIKLVISNNQNAKDLNLQKKTPYHYLYLIQKIGFLKINF